MIVIRNRVTKAIDPFCNLTTSNNLDAIPLIWVNELECKKKCQKKASKSVFKPIGNNAGNDEV